MLWHCFQLLGFRLYVFVPNPAEFLRPVPPKPLGSQGMTGMQVRGCAHLHAIVSPNDVVLLRRLA